MGSTIYLGGDFWTINGSTPRSHSAAVDATSGTATPWNPNPSGPVQAIVVSGSTVYLGGTLTTTTSHDTTHHTRHRLALD